MNLLIMRHGEAEPYAGETTDASRSLTDRGVEYVHQVGVRLAEFDRNRSKLDVLLVSPFLRTQQTADIVADNLGSDPKRKTCDWLLSESSVEYANRQLDQMFTEAELETALIVSHMPFVSLLSEFLTGSRLIFQPGSVALVEFDVIGREQGACSWIT